MLKLTSDESVRGNNVIEYPFTVSMIDRCVNDELSNPSFIDDFDYFIGSTGLTTIPTPTYTQLYTNCQVDWTLYRLDQGLETTLTSK